MINTSMFSRKLAGYKSLNRMQGKSFRCQPRIWFVFVVLLCSASIFVMNLYTSTWYTNKVITSVYIRNDSDVTKIEATTFPNDILHDWRGKEKSALGIFILSAIGSNTTEHKGFKADIKLSGWGGRNNMKMRCCILLNSGVVATFNHPRSVIGVNYAKLPAYQYVCPVSTSIYNVRGVTIQLAQLKCPKNNDRYIKPYIPKKILTEESFAICLKLLYGHVDHTNLIEWLEYNREIGVDRVFMFTYNLTEATRTVLKPYIKLGYIQTRPFAYPWNNTRRVGEKSTSAWADEQVIVFDCLQRLSGYKYMAIVDIDEFLVPRKHEDIKRMMKFLMMKYPAAGGFTLSSYLFLKDVKPASNITGNVSDIMRYFTRTPGLIGKLSRMKNIVLPSRITAKGLHTHRFNSRRGYRRVKVQTEVASMNHYRNCYENQKEFCSKELTTDTFILKFVERLRNRTSKIV